MIKLKHFILFNIFSLSIIGVIAIYSGTFSKYPDFFSNPFVIRQMIFMLFGILTLILFSHIDFHLYFKISKVLYIIGLVILLLVLFIFSTVKGRWINLGIISIQPSEFMKLMFIPFLASVFASYYMKKDKEFFGNLIFFIIRTAVFTIIPFFLILKQPDLGTSLIFIAVWLVMLIFLGSGILPISCILLFSLGIISGVFIRIVSEGRTSNILSFLLSMDFRAILIIYLSTVFFSFLIFILFKYLIGMRSDLFKMTIILIFLVSGFFASNLFVKHLKPYQKNRIVVFLNPYSDVRGSGWNVIQSKISIGSGGITGKGYLKGTQNQLYFLPEKHTDFIYSLISEEFGFIGSSLVLLLQIFLLLSIITAIKRCKDIFGFYILISIFTVFTLHIFANIGMNMGLLPITGLPLPFISYGGSFYLVCCVLLGIVMNIYSQTRDIASIDMLR